MSPERPRAKHSAEKNIDKQGSFELALPIRIGIAVVLLIISALVKIPVLRIILLVLSIVCAGYDIFLSAVDSIAEKQYFSNTVVVLFTAVLGFVIGYAVEATVMVILFQLSKYVLDYTRNRALSSARGLVGYQEENFGTRVDEILSADHAGEMKIQRTIENSAVFVLRFIFVFALLYVILLPLLTGLSFRVSIHRALMILLVSSPLSVTTSFAIVGITGLCHNAGNGILYNSTEIMEEATELNVALFDKAGVFAEETPHVIGLQSDILDKKTFLNFLAHAVYYSDQPFAKAISDYYNQEYRLELINNFSEIAGNGVSLEIGQAPVVLATKSYFDAQGITVPDRGMPDGIPYYMTVAGRYVGRVVISSEINEDAESIVEQMNNVGISRNILLTEDGEEQSQAAAEALHFTEVIGECDMDKKLRLISDISQTGHNKTVFVYASGIEGHSAADVDMRVSKKGKYADVLVVPECFMNIPDSIRACARTKEIIAENAIIAFVIKAILLFLSITGYCNLWFVVFVDTVAALSTMLNAIRVTSPSLLKVKNEQ